MPDPQLVAHPVHPPGHCFTCGASEGPVVDTMVDLLGEGRIYLCVRTCVGVFARLAGWSDPGEVARLVEDVQYLEGRVRGLTEELERERESKVVSVSDMVGLIDRMRETGPVTLVTKEQIAASASKGPHFEFPLCSETRVDGTPCTAEALPGRDVCLAHSKRKAGVA